MVQNSKMGRNPFQKTAPQTPSEARTDAKARLEPKAKSETKHHQKSEPKPSALEQWLANHIITRTVVAGLKGLLVVQFLIKRH